MDSPEPGIASVRAPGTRELIAAEANRGADRPGGHESAPIAEDLYWFFDELHYRRFHRVAREVLDRHLGGLISGLITAADYPDPGPDQLRRVPQTGRTVGDLDNWIFWNTT